MTMSVDRIRTGVLPVGTWTPPSGNGETFHYVDIGSLDREAKAVVGVTELPVREAPSRARQLLRTDDVLVSTVRPNLNAVAMVPPQHDGAVGSTGFTVLRANPERLLPRFLFHWVRTPMFVADMVKKATGASYPAVSDRIVLDSSMPMPAVAVQRRIADILDKADAIRRRRREAIALTEELMRSAFLETFGDPVTNPKGWPLKPFDDLVAETRLGLVRAAAEQGQTRAYPYIRMNAISSDGHLDVSNLTRVDATDEEVSSSRLKDGDFLFNTRNSRELVGKAAVFHGDDVHLFNNNILRVRFRPGVESDFVSAYWQTAAAQRELDARKAGTTSVFAIYYKNLATLPVPVPPASAQTKYARLCAAGRQSVRTHERDLAEADHLFNALVGCAFSGTEGPAC